MFSHAERLRHMAAGSSGLESDAKKYGGEAESNKLNIAHYNAQAAALLAGAEALEQTTPEPISEKRQNGNWWLVCLDGVWVQGHFDARWGSWRISPNRWLSKAPTHALPMPPSPTTALAGTSMFSARKSTIACLSASASSGMEKP